MACPFVKHASPLTRQSSVAHDNTAGWGIEDDIAEIPDALTLKNLQAAIQLLTSPLVSKLTQLLLIFITICYLCFESTI